MGIKKAIKATIKKRKLLSVGFSSLLLSSITLPAASATTWDYQYESIWHLSEFWPGEYPSRFSVVKDGIVLPCRTTMKLTAAKDLKCPVPKYATFSPWNNDRNKADDLLYKTVSKVATVTIDGDVKVPAQRQPGDAEVTLDLKAGDTLAFLVYHAEGYALYRHKEQQYIINEGDFAHKASFEKDRREDDLWLRLPAEKNGHGWVLYSDAIKTDGIAVTEIEGFGIANDLPDPSTLSLKGVGFHSASAKLTDDSKKILDSLATKLRQLTGVKYEVAGYTDNSGDSTKNQALSQLRADAVVNYLVNERGIHEAKLKATGYGEANPIADNATPAGRTINRRVELKLL